MASYAGLVLLRVGLMAREVGGLCLPAVPSGCSGAGRGHCCPQLLGVQPHRGSCPITSAGVALPCWLNELVREDQLSWLSYPSLLEAQGVVVWPAQGT